jgi:beta propeller repeat protein/parallel beta-helix repeat protein
MRKTLFLSIVIILVSIIPSSAEIRHVPSEYVTIQYAINLAVDGDTIIVEPGVYIENINFLGKNITVTSTDPENPDIVATTIIDGYRAGSVVTFNSGEGLEAVLTGFTITGGVGTYNVDFGDENYIYWGAGIYCSNASPTIKNNVISGNTGPQTMEGDNPNTWQLGYGGGISCFESDAIIYRNIIKDNTAFAGAGIMTYFGTPVICNNLIYENSANVGGGVILLGGSLINNTIADNNVDKINNELGFAGNVYVEIDTEIEQCIIKNNIICNAKSGGGISLSENLDGSSSFSYNNVWGNLPSNYIDPETNENNSRRRIDKTDLNGNISQDPLLEDDYHIHTDSPCRDAGDPDYIPYSWQRDIDGEYTVMGECTDIGADEVTANVRPVADAGENQYLDSITEQVSLDGSGSYDPDASGIITFQWRQISGPNVVLSNHDTSEPDFMPEFEDIYIFELIVSDGSNNSVPDRVMIVIGNRAPVANAGDDQICEPAQEITLDGSGSYDPDENDVLSYRWVQTSGPIAELSDPNTQNPRLTPPVQGEYIFELTVNDGEDTSLPDTVIINCTIGSPPDGYGYRWIDSSSNWGPQFDWIDIQGTGTKISGINFSLDECFGPFEMGFDFNFYGNTYNQFYIQSNGLISFGSEPITNDNRQIPAEDEFNNIIAWMWTFMYPSNESEIYIQHFQSQTVVQFVDYAIARGGTVNAEVIFNKSDEIIIQYKDFSSDAYLYEYTIGIENAAGTIGTQVAFNNPDYLHDELAIEFSLGPPYRPSANAGIDQYLDGIELVRLDGTGSTDRDPCDVLTYQWTQIDGPDVQLNDITAAQPTFMPEVTGEYRFQLIVSDGALTSEPDDVLIVVGNRPPVADAGPNKVLQVPGQIILDGTGSYDLDLTDEITYSWRQLDGPQVVLEDANTATASFYCDQEGFYVFELILYDGLVYSEPCIVEVTTVTVTMDQLDLDVGFNSSDYFHYPDISGHKVVYALGYACDYTWNIIFKDLGTDRRRSFSAGGIDTQPKIDGDIVVWFGGIDWGSPWYHEPSNTSVIARNIATNTQRVLRRYSMSESYSHPAVSGNKVVWLEHLGLDPNPIGSSEANNWWNTPYNVCGADITDMNNPVYFTIAENVGTRDPYPCHNYGSDFDDVIDISGNIVVYEANGDIYGADISNLDDIIVFTICSDPSRQFDPAIYGNIVVWTDQRNDSGDIYGADISDIDNIREFVVIKTADSQQQPAIDDCMIVYVDGTSEGGHIKACCLTKQYGTLEIEISGSPFGTGPAIDNGNIVWQTSSYGQVQGISLNFAYSSIDGPIKNATTGKYYEYIQHAINGSLDGDVIEVEPGFYYENILIENKNIKLRSIEPNNPHIVADTIITGGNHGATVTFSGIMDANCELTGFTITGGNKGIYCDYTSPTITNCCITGNLDAGIYLYHGSNPILSRCDISANSGSGIKMLPYIPGRLKYYNHPELSNCIITANQQHGITGDFSIISNCTICDNLQSGIHNSTATITNSIIYFNGDGTLDAQIPSESSTVTFSDIQSLEQNSGNMDSDPLFADPLNGDYHLKSQTGRWDPISLSWIQDDVSSPCIDTGDPNSDIGAEPEPNGSVVNMGAYGGTAQASKSAGI